MTNTSCIGIMASTTVCTRLSTSYTYVTVIISSASVVVATTPVIIAGITVTVATHVAGIVLAHIVVIT